ncbi:MAG: hypothetical protein HYS07_03085 [Chlamydiae bacterium]|nr:hypothetical protein [Chlamydiota bacterium]MBI3277174.1 hypothetical protein [Chlamydiota bacterium]
MTNKEFLKKLTHTQGDFIQEFFHLLEKEDASFCVIGGLAVNAYAEPVVSLDLDIVIVSQKIDVLIPQLKKIFKLKIFPNSINISSDQSDLRIQIQRDPRYQSFIQGAQVKDVLGYRFPVASIEDVVQGKIWAIQDPNRRPSKRQKDLADLMRLVETQKELMRLIPEEIQSYLNFLSS